MNRSSPELVLLMSHVGSGTVGIENRFLGFRDVRPGSFFCFRSDIDRLGSWGFWKFG